MNRLLYDFDATNFKINVCILKAKNGLNLTLPIGKALKKAQSALSARLPQENFHGVVDLMQKIHPDATNTEIQRALVR